MTPFLIFLMQIDNIVDYEPLSCTGVFDFARLSSQKLLDLGLSYDLNFFFFNSVLDILIFPLFCQVFREHSPALASGAQRGCEGN